MNTTYIYIEDSGNLNNTNTMVIVFVVFESITDVINTELCIQNYLQEKFQNLYKELHFNRESYAIKKSFFKHIQLQKFIIKYYLAYSVTKNIHYINHLIQSILDNKDIFNESKVFIDGDTTSNKYPLLLYRIKKELKSKNIPLKSIRFENSKNNLLIQLADMCAGCIRRNFEIAKKEDKELFSLLHRFIKM